MRKSALIAVCIFVIILFLVVDPRNSIAQTASSIYSQSTTIDFRVPYLNPLRSGDSTFHVFVNVSGTQLTDHTNLSVIATLSIPWNFLNDSYPVSTDIQNGLPLLVAMSLNNIGSSNLWTKAVPNPARYADTKFNATGLVQFTTDGKIGLDLQMVFSANANVTDEMYSVARNNSTLLALLYDKLSNNTRIQASFAVPIEIGSLQQAQQGQTVISQQSQIASGQTEIAQLIQSGNSGSTTSQQRGNNHSKLD